MDSIKKYFFFLCLYFFQGALASQIIAFGVRSQQSSIINTFLCKNALGEIFKTFILNDSLFFEKKGMKQFVGPIKNKSKFNTLPVIACDNSQTTNKGRIYICWSDEKNGLNNKDVFLVYSADTGKTWTEPILVTYRPNHKDQFMPELLIDDKGLIYLIYYDTQNYFESGYVDVYLAISYNGGLKYNYFRLNNSPVKQQLKMQTEHTLHLASEQGKIAAGWKWTKKDEPKLLIITDSLLLTKQKNDLSQIIINKTFPFSKLIKLDYSAKENLKLTAVLTKPLLAGFEKIVVKNIAVKKGTNYLLIDTEKLGLQKGNYVLTLYYQEKNEFIWITEE